MNMGLIHALTWPCCCSAWFVHLPVVPWKHSYEVQLGQGAGLIPHSVPLKPLTMGFELLCQLLEPHRVPRGLAGARSLFPEASVQLSLTQTSSPSGQVRKSVSDSLIK